jgi:hypothetical protein
LKAIILVLFALCGIAFRGVAAEGVASNSDSKVKIDDQKPVAIGGATNRPSVSVPFRTRSVVALTDVERKLVLKRLARIRNRLVSIVRTMDASVVLEFLEEDVRWDKCISSARVSGLGLTDVSRISFSNGIWIWLNDEYLVSINFGDAVFSKTSNNWDLDDKRRLLADCSKDWRRVVRTNGKIVAELFGIKSDEINWEFVEPRFGAGDDWSRHLVIQMPSDESLSKTGVIGTIAMEIDECTLTIRSFEIRNAEYLRVVK